MADVARTRCDVVMQRKKKGRVRAKDRPSKQKKHRQGWSKPDMRKQHARTCVSCRTIRPQHHLVRVVRVVESNPIERIENETNEDVEGKENGNKTTRVVVDWNYPMRSRDDDTSNPIQPNTHVDANQRTKWNGRSAYLCPKRTCCEHGAVEKKGNPVARALKIKCLDLEAAQDLRNMIHALSKMGWLEDETDDETKDIEGNPPSARTAEHETGEVHAYVTERYEETIERSPIKHEGTEET
uniref:Uncharacterized protein n=1 Tax=Picocystis salinarum TaxID=88271 RepID=A0A7S3U9E4_9CHLO